MAQILINMALGQIYQTELKHDSSLNKMYKALNYSIQKKISITKLQQETILEENIKH